MECKHKERKIWARNRCKPCYQLWWKNKTTAGIECQNRYKKGITRKLANQRVNFGTKENDITKKQWEKLLKLSNGVCCSCKENKELTVDHIIPLSKCGKNNIFNIQFVCRSCNSSKHTKETRFIELSQQLEATIS